MSGFSQSKIAIAVSLLCGLGAQKVAFGEETAVGKKKILNLKLLK